jgi:nucleotidyltransferase/DNA polymerase involved in DNA repair
VPQRGYCTTPFRSLSGRFHDDHGGFANFSPEVEAISLDEAFLEMTGSEQLLGDPESIGRRLKDPVREATGGLTASVGLSATKYVAKVASACQNRTA